MEEKAKELAALLKILANENRLLIFCALMERPMTVSEIATRTRDITQPALSQHLSLLKTSGILECEKAGQNMIYSIADHRVKEIIYVLKKHYCDDDVAE